jgi:adhesin transport system outer membrane protein
VREAWNQRGQRAELAGLLRDQAGVNSQLVSSYREQFRVGERSLLDVLGAQNTRFNSAILSQTAVYASLFAEYRLLAATGSLASVLGTAPVEQGEAYARDEFRVKSVESPDYNRLPSRQTSALPLDLLAPIRKE